MKAMAFDAYGTLFDVFSVTALGEELFPGKGDALAQLWRLKQLQYSMLRSLMGRHRDFWQLTEDALVYAARSLGLDPTPDRRARLLEAYLTLAAFPDVRPGLAALKARGLRLAILSNGEPKMLEAAARRWIQKVWRPVEAAPATSQPLEDTKPSSPGRTRRCSGASW